MWGGRRRRDSEVGGGVEGRGTQNKGRVAVLVCVWGVEGGEVCLAKMKLRIVVCGKKMRDGDGRLARFSP